MVKVSVVVPVYNISSSVLRQCMDSVFEQTYSDYEVILVDDGSDNGAGEMCDEFARKDSRFRVIHQENKGVSAARNAGTDAAEGEWIIYLDPDDWWEKNTLETVCKYMGENHLDILVFAYFDNFPDIQNERRCWRDPHPQYMEIDEKIKHNLQIGLLDENVRSVTGYFGAVWMQIQRLDLIRKKHIRFPDKVRKSEDTIFNLCLIDAAERIGILDIALYHYRHHGASLCSRFTPDIEEVIGMAGKELFRICEKKSTEYTEAYKIFMVKNYLAVLRQKYFHSDNPDSEREKKQQWKRFIRYHDGFVDIEDTDLKLLFKKRKIMAILYFVSFKMRSYFLLKVIYNLYKHIKKE